MTRLTSISMGSVSVLTPLVAASWTRYRPDLGKEMVVDAEDGLLKVAVAGPETWDQAAV